MRTLIIHNPKSGFGSDAIYEFERALVRPGDECVIRLMKDEISDRHLVRDAERFDLVVISGGDGTVTSMLYNLRDRNVLTCVFPSGTANLFFANLGNAAEPSALARACRMGHSTLTDLAEVMWLDEQGRRHRAGFGLMAGLGYDAQLMEAAIPEKRAMGQAAYFAAALANPRPQVQRFVITVDGITYERRGISCMVANNAMIQGDIEIVPDCSMDDGLINVVMLETDYAAKLIKPLLFGMVDKEGKRIGRPHLETWKGREVRIECDAALTMQVDGDLVEGHVTSYLARALPKANRLVVDNMGRYKSSDTEDEQPLFGGTEEIPFPDPKA